MKLLGRVTISRPSSTNEGDYINIAFEEGLSGIQFLEARMSMEDFAYAVTGLGCLPVTLELRGLGRLGMTLVSKSESVPDLGSERRAEALAPFEVDGWTARTSDYGNHHRRTTPNGKAHYSVLFQRHVPTPESAVTTPADTEQEK